MRIVEPSKVLDKKISRSHKVLILQSDVVLRIVILRFCSNGVNGCVCLVSCEIMCFVADYLLFQRLCSSVGPLVRWSIRHGDRVEKYECLSVGAGLECGWGLDAPAHSDIVTPRHLLDASSHVYKRL